MTTTQARSRDANKRCVVMYRVTLRGGTIRDVPTLADAEALWRAERRDGWPSVLTRLRDGAEYRSGVWWPPAVEQEG